jgi:hypothetical protein
MSFLGSLQQVHGELLLPISTDSNKVNYVFTNPLRLNFKCLKFILDLQIFFSFHVAFNGIQIS